MVRYDKQVISEKEMDRRCMLLYFYSNYFQTVEYLLYGDEEKYTMGLYSDLPELI